MRSIRQLQERGVSPVYRPGAFVPPSRRAGGFLFVDWSSVHAENSHSVLVK